MERYWLQNSRKQTTRNTYLHVLCHDIRRDEYIEYRSHPETRVLVLIYTCNILLRCCTRLNVIPQNHNFNFWFLYMYMHIRAHILKYTRAYTQCSNIEQTRIEHVCNRLALGFIVFIVVSAKWPRRTMFAASNRQIH